MGLEIGTEPFPDEAVSALASALEPLEPHPCGLEVHLLKPPAVAVHAKVLEMSTQSPAERGVLVRKRRVPVAPTPLAEISEESPDLRLACFHAQAPASPAGPAPVHREAEEVERSRS